MLVIRTDQMAVFQAAAEMRYAAALAGFFRDQAPSLVGKRQLSELEELIGSALAEARRRGIVSGEGLAMFTALVLSAGPGFLENEAVRHFLALPGAPPDRKLRRLVELIATKLHGEAT